MDFTEDELHEFLGTKPETAAEEPAEEPKEDAQESGSTPDDPGDGLPPEGGDAPEEGPAADPEDGAAPESEAADREAAIRSAVEAALAKEREQTRGAWADFFARAKLKNSFTGEDITSKEQFDKWSADFEAAQLEKNLRDGKLTPEALNRAVAENPAVKRAEALVRQQEAERQAREKEAFDEQVAREIAEIGKMDPGIKSVEDLLKMPGADRFQAYVRRGNSFLEAYRLASFDTIMARQREESARRAAQAAVNSQRSKAHLTPAESRGTGAAPVPDETMELYRQLMPGASEAQIAEHYNRTKKNMMG